jgi:putative membrane-bound dehydrogenase-like protein
MKKILLLPLALLAVAIGVSQNAKPSSTEVRHVKILFLGAPTSNAPVHDPVERYRVLKKALGVDGINLTYTEDLADIRREVLDHYDGVLLYGNWKQNEPMDPAQEQALLSYVREGGAFLPIHCASACFGGSDAFVKLVGGRFKSHGEGVFRTTITNKNHPIMRGYSSFEAWDETYVHDRLNDDRKVLQVRDKEPWTWVRDEGKGKVFYTAYGHDMRCWDQPAFHELLRRAILWSVGAEVRATLAAMKLPKLETEPMVLPGYRERKTITEGQKPLPPQESIKLAQVPTGFEISLFASEPDIVNPIHVTWDDRGRAYVTETVDYPNHLQAKNTGHDRIQLCEDTNGDGKADKFTLFADKLSVPTSAVFVNGGLISTNGTDMILLKDTNHDGKADVRKVLFTGFKMHDTHAGVSNLRYGHDNWVYATIGYSGFEGTVGGKEHKFGTGFFRFKPDASELEFLQNTTNNTWGLGFTSDFDILGSTANGNPSWYFTFPKGYYDYAGLLQPRTPNKDGNPKFFPASMDIRQVDQMDRYTSAAGHAFYTSNRFPQSYRDQIAFVCEPTGKLVGQFQITRSGAGFVSKQLPNNLYSSADAWSGPVHAETGPDGAVWICDWYNLIIQHNPTPNKNSAGYDAKNGKGNAYETPVRDVKHGRIYRVYPTGSQNDSNPKLATNNFDSLVAGLGHPNLFWRLQAQRLIVESGSASAHAKLKEIVKTSPGSAAALHAFYSLQGLNALDADTVKLALTSNNRGLRRAATQTAPLDESTASVLIKNDMLSAADAREYAETFVALTRIAPSETIGKALYATLAGQKDVLSADPVVTDAWQTAARHHAPGVILASLAKQPAGTSSAPVNLIPNADFSNKELGPWSLRPYKLERPDSIDISIVPGGKNDGNALKIISPFVADAGVGATFSINPNTRYRLGGIIRTENFENRGGRGAMLNVHGIDAATEGISGTRDWTPVSCEFDSGNRTEILVHCLIGGFGGGTGTAWFDDLYLYETNSGDAGAGIAAVAQHFASKGDPAARKALADALASRTDDFSKNLFTSLNSGPAATVATIRKNKPDPAVHARGLEIYGRTCVACHGPDGKGVPGAFPPLDGADWVTGDVTVPIRIVLGGLQGPIEVNGQKYANIMPPHTDLKDGEIADVLTYIRQTWSNDAIPASEATVKATRAKYSNRTQPWTAAELK